MGTAVDPDPSGPGGALRGSGRFPDLFPGIEDARSDHRTGRYDPRCGASGLHLLFTVRPGAVPDSPVRHPRDRLRAAGQRRRIARHLPGEPARPSHQRLPGSDRSARVSGAGAPDRERSGAAAAHPAPRRSGRAGDRRRRHAPAPQEPDRPALSPQSSGTGLAQVPQRFRTVAFLLVRVGFKANALSSSLDFPEFARRLDDLRDVPAGPGTSLGSDRPDSRADREPRGVSPGGGIGGPHEIHDPSVWGRLRHAGGPRIRLSSPRDGPDVCERRRSPAPEPIRPRRGGLSARLRPARELQAELLRRLHERHAGIAQDAPRRLVGTFPENRLAHPGRPRPEEARRAGGDGRVEDRPRRRRGILVLHADRLPGRAAHEHPSNAESSNTSAATPSVFPNLPQFLGGDLVGSTVRTTFAPEEVQRWEVPAPNGVGLLAVYRLVDRSSRGPVPVASGLPNEATNGSPVRR